MVMRTVDVINLGIDRNFLRICEEKKLIDPKRVDSEWITNKNYVPREYTQKEIEIVWNAYLCRKMGLSFEEIKALNRGEEVCTRASLSKMISKYENQIQELQAIVDFMKYVKGFGFIPSPPSESLGSTDFKNYLIDFINQIDHDRSIKKYIEFTDRFANIADFEKITDDDVACFDTLTEELALSFDVTEIDTNGQIILSLKEKTHLDPMCDDVQSIIRLLYDSQKRAHKNANMSAWDFAYTYVYMLLLDSDLSAFFKNALGEDVFDFLVLALLAFLYIEDSEEFKEHIGDPEKLFNSNSKNSIKEVD